MSAHLQESRTRKATVKVHVGALLGQVACHDMWKTQLDAGKKLPAFIVVTQHPRLDREINVTSKQRLERGENVDVFARAATCPRFSSDFSDRSSLFIFFSIDFFRSVDCEIIARAYPQSASARYYYIFAAEQRHSVTKLGYYVSTCFRRVRMVMKRSQL